MAKPRATTGAARKRRTKAKRPRVAAQAKRKASRHAKLDTRAIELTLADLAHDIRTPLTGILSLGELLATSGLAERERGWASAIKSTAEHLSMLTSLIVDAARAPSKRLVLRRELVRPRRLAEAVAASLAGRAEAKGLTSEAAIAADLPDAVIGDPLRLRGALENLIDNAVKFSERGSVRFEAACGTGRARPGAAGVHGGGQRHRPHGSGDQAAVPAVCAGEREDCPALRRRRPWAGVRQTYRQGDGRRLDGDERTGSRNPLSPDRGRR